LASRLGREGINVNTLACGPFASKMMKQTLKDYEAEIVAGVPLGRIGTPEDIAGACLFLSSRAGEWITG
jgi:NAD(P)-dependent dehydrogenase (short-subunit alcohol dehydrogenase family)